MTIFTETIIRFVYPPKILHNHSLRFLLKRLWYPGEIRNNGYVKFWGVNKVHYSLDENGEFKVSSSQGTLRTERRLGVGRGGEAALKGLICIILLFLLLSPY